MLQNKLIFNQSSVSLEIIGLPDFSNNENQNQISIISQWKLMIINKPLIEGNIEHLKSVMEAFYSYSYLLINNEVALYESSLIDIKTDNFVTHEVVLKSSKPNVKPLNLKIGNSIIADIINCFDQLTSSDKTAKINYKSSKTLPKNDVFKIIKKLNIKNALLPPLLSIFSIFLISSSLIYFYDSGENKQNNSALYLKKIFS